VANVRIFSTVWHDKNRVNLMLYEEQPRTFLLQDGGEAFFPVENSRGRNAFGVDLESVERKIFIEALMAAWVSSANKRCWKSANGKRRAS
jgi:hypothetical protein